jgi:deoxyadenosine/deoxycytidine kinase
MASVLEHKPFVVVAGNIGAGKSTLALKLGKALGVPVHQEPELNEFLDEFYESNCQKAGFQVQMSFLGQRAVMYRDIAKKTQLGAVVDRSIEEDLIFAEMLAMDDLITPEEFCCYRRLYGIITTPLLKADYIVFVKASPEVCLERIAKRARPNEAKITLDYLKNLDHRYQKWIESKWTTFWIKPMEDTANNINSDPPVYTVNSEEEIDMDKIVFAIHNRYERAFRYADTLKNMK